MIKTENGYAKIAGTGPELLADLEVCVWIVAKNIAETIGAAGTEELIRESFDYAVARLRKMENLS